MTDPAHKHHLLRCKKCTAIVMQCRCPSPSKTEHWVDSCHNCIAVDSPPPQLKLPHWMRKKPDAQA